MGYRDQSEAVFVQKATLYLFGCVFIYCARAFIEYQNRSMSDICASQSDPLLLSSGKAVAFVYYHLICPIKFFGNYLISGMIIVLNLWSSSEKCVGFFPCAGMHGGKMFLRSTCEDVVFPEQVTARRATCEDKAELKFHLSEYCRIFNLDIEEVLSSPFTVITPDSKNPYKRMYVAN